METLNYDALRIWVEVALFVIQGGFSIWVWMFIRGDKTNDRITDLSRDTKESLDDHGTRLASLEGKVAAAPTHDDLGGIHDRITEVVKLQERMAGEFQTVKGTLNMIHQHLLTGGGSR